MAKKVSTLKVLGIAATVVGMAASLFSDWVGDKKMDDKIEEKVCEAIAKKEK